MTVQFVSDLSMDIPRVPSSDERLHYYTGLPSSPNLIARSSTNPWVMPVGPAPYLVPKKCSPIGHHHLNEVWEDSIIPAVRAYLLGECVEYTHLDPIRIGTIDASSPPVILWVGVVHGSLSSERGLEVALGCRSILLNRGIDDIHIEIHESQVLRSARLYSPASHSNPIAQVVEPFSTTLGISICNAATPYIGGTGALFFVDPRHPGKLFLLTVRHLLFHPGKEPNDHYEYRQGSGQPRRKVLFLDEAAFKARTIAIETEIRGKKIIIDYLKRRLAYADKTSEKSSADKERNKIQSDLKEVEETIEELRKFLTDVTKKWKDPKERIIGHVVLSPPISLGLGAGEHTEDWAVVEILPSAVNKSNFVGNAIDLGTSIPIDELTTAMYPCPSNPHSFEYPVNRLLEFYGTISQKRIQRPDPKTEDLKGNAAIMVLKRGLASDLTIGCVNNIRSVTRTYIDGKLEGESREVAVLPCDPKRPGPFSKDGDSGSAVVSGAGEIAGIITGGAGISDALDITYVTPIDFIVERLAEFGFHANLFPTVDDIS